VIVDVFGQRALNDRTLFHTFVCFSTNNQQINTSLKELNLYGNGIGDTGATAVAEALKVSYGVFYMLFLMFLVSAEQSGTFSPRLRSSLYQYSTGQQITHHTGPLMERDWH
jgi:hypothetical protein